MSDYYNPLHADALIRTRDGIVGSWAPPGVSPPPLGLDQASNLERWEPGIRASIFDYELFSRIGFKSPPADETISISHLETAPTLAYLPLVNVTRPTKEIFQRQLDYLDRYADLRPDRAAEILTQSAQPGQFFSAIAFLRPDRTHWTLELLEVGFRLAHLVEMRVKHALACRRPIELSPQVQPMILTPGHGSLPSGHSTETFLMATLLWSLMRAGANPAYQHVFVGVQLLRQAARIAINRTVAGVHFPVDSAAGAVLGMTLGGYLVNRMSGGDSYKAWAFKGPSFPPGDDFDWVAIYDVLSPVVPIRDQPNGSLAYVENLESQTIAASGQSPALSWLWEKAVQEWA